MIYFTHTLRQMLEGHLVRQIPSSITVDFGGLLLLESAQMYHPSYLCLGEPTVCAQTLSSLPADFSGGCLICAGDSPMLHQAVCPSGMTLFVTDLPLIPFSNLLNRHICQLNHLYTQLSSVSPYHVKNLLKTARRLTGASFILMDNSLSILYDCIAPEDLDIFTAFTNSQQKNAELITNLTGFHKLPAEPALCEKVCTENVQKQIVFLPFLRSSDGCLLGIGSPDNSLLASTALFLRELCEPLLTSRLKPLFQNWSFRRLLSRIMAENGDSDDMLMTMLRNLPSPPMKNMRLILIRSQFYMDDEEDPFLDQLLPFVTAFFPNQHAAVMSKEIVVLLSSETLHCPITFEISDFEAFLETHQAIAMIANPFTSIMSMRITYRQGQRMFPVILSVKLDDEIRCMTFTRYTQYNVIDICARSISTILGSSDVVLLCHPSILAVTRYDRAYGTNLRDIMFHYLMNDRSISKTSAQMFMHRNTIIYKIKKIEELIGESMDDPYLRHNLIFSCLLLRYRELYQKEGIPLSPFEATNRIKI